MEPSTESSMSTSSLPADTPVLNESTPSGVQSPTTSSPADPSHPTTAAPAPAPTSAPPADASVLKPPIVPPVRKISAALLKASLSSLSSDDPSFAFAALAPSLPLVLAQSANGVDTVRRVSDFVEKVVRAKQAYAAALLSAVTDATRPLTTPIPAPTSADRLQSPPMRTRAGSGAGLAAAGKPRSGSTAGLVAEGEIGARWQTTWKTLLDVVQAEGLSDAAAARAYHDTVAVPLADYHRELAHKHAAVAEHAAEMQAQVKASQERLLQTKIAVLKLVEAQQFAEEREAHEREDKARAEGGKGGSDLASAAKSLKTGLSFIFKSKDKQMTEALHSLSSEELRLQAYEATQGYVTAVEVANHRSNTFYDHDLPTILRQVQMMEATRLETLRLHLEQLSLHLSGVMAPADKRVESLSAAVAAMQTKADLDDYVQAVTASIGTTSAKPAPYVYDLPFTADDIKRGPVSLHAPHTGEVKDARLFGCSLLQVMEGQRSRHPSLDVPWIVPLLCEQIKKGGKPVFAASVDSDEVMRARRRLEEGEGVQNDDAELAAAVLKMWLRDLEPHVVSGDAYTQGVEAAKAQELSSDAVLRVFKLLPDVNQKVVEWVASTMMEVAGREAGAMDTAATVLTPHLMQSPTAEASAMLAINAEIAFVQALLLTVSTHHPVGRAGNGVSGELPKVEVAKLEDSALEADDETHK